MAGQSIKIERFLKKRYLGHFKYEGEYPFNFVKCEKNDPEKKLSISTIEVRGKTVYVVYISSDAQFKPVYGWLQKCLDASINYGCNHFHLQIKELTEDDQIRKSLREHFLGDRRYKNHDFRIIKISLLRIKDKAHEWMSWKRRKEYGEPDVLKLTVIFGMKNFRGDRSFIFEYIKKETTKHLNKHFPGNYKIEHLVAMDKETHV